MHLVHSQVSSSATVLVNGAHATRTDYADGSFVVSRRNYVEYVTVTTSIAPNGATITRRITTHYDPRNPSNDVASPVPFAVPSVFMSSHSN